MMDIVIIRPLIIGLMGWIEYNGYKKGYGLEMKVLRSGFIERNIAYQIVVKGIIEREKVVLE